MAVFFTLRIFDLTLMTQVDTHNQFGYEFRFIKKKKSTSLKNDNEIKSSKKKIRAPFHIVPKQNYY